MIAGTRCGIRDGFFDKFALLEDETPATDPQTIKDSPTFRVMCVENQDDYKRLDSQTIHDAFFNVDSAVESGCFMVNSETIDLANNIDYSVRMSQQKSPFNRRRVL